jgi:hypothetical protein
MREDTRLAQADRGVRRAPKVTDHVRDEVLLVLPRQAVPLPPESSRKLELKQRGTEENEA